MKTVSKPASVMDRERLAIKAGKSGGRNAVYVS
jgi:hypothetical protein